MNVATIAAFGDRTIHAYHTEGAGKMFYTACYGPSLLNSLQGEDMRLMLLWSVVWTTSYPRLPTLLGRIPKTRSMNIST